MSDPIGESIKRPPSVVVVNNRQVTLPDNETTGHDLKAAAIAQHVPIQIDFKLFRIDGSTQHAVRDDEKIRVHSNEQFRAVASDDNS